MYPPTARSAGTLDAYQAVCLRVKVETLGRGVLLPELKLALDTSGPGLESVVSHAHGDHIPWHATHAYATPETTDLIAVRKPDLEVTRVPWREPTRVGRARITFYPAGHILGSALTLIEAPGGETLLYTGDTKTRESLTAPTAEFPEADNLIVESTFGLPIFRFPEHGAIAAQMGRFARETLAEGAIPVFLGYSLGKSQEILAILHAQGVPTVAHGAVWNMCRMYEQNGCAFPTTRPYAPGTVKDAALVVPGSFRDHPMVSKLDARIAYVSGWALLPRSRVQHDADELVPLSDHADFPGLLDIVARVKPKRIYCNHGYADVFSHVLTKMGHRAAPLSVGHLDEDTSTQSEGIPLGEPA